MQVVDPLHDLEEDELLWCPGKHKRDYCTTVVSFLGVWSLIGDQLMFDDGVAVHARIPPPMTIDPLESRTGYSHSRSQL